MRMTEVEKKKIKYRKVKTCANCRHCEDMGIDEEALECVLLKKWVDHDCVCKHYKEWEEYSWTIRT